MMSTRTNLRNARWLTAFGSLLLAACFVLLSDGRAADTVRDKPVEFALIADTPYDGGQEKEFANLVTDINSADLAFVVHGGDFWSDGLIWDTTTAGIAPCSDEAFDNRLRLTRAFRHPFIFVPGDNDWTDCYRAKPHAYEPIERLARLRRAFYPDDQSLGQRTMPLTRQSAGPGHPPYRENVRWIAGGVVFVTLHMTGSNNNLGRTPEMDAEYEKRNAANLAWLNAAFDIARREGSRALMVIAHANPAFENTWPGRYQRRYLLGGLGLKPPETRRETGFDEFLAELEAQAEGFGKPVVYVHGDTHTFRIDKPLVGTISRRTIENFTRVETFGWPDTHWVRVTIDPEDPNVFRFRQQIVAGNRPTH